MCASFCTNGKSVFFRQNMSSAFNCDKQLHEISNCLILTLILICVLFFSSLLPDHSIFIAKVLEQAAICCLCVKDTWNQVLLSDVCQHRPFIEMSLKKEDSVPSSIGGHCCSLACHVASSGTCCLNLTKWDLSEERIATCMQLQFTAN